MNDTGEQTPAPPSGGGLTTAKPISQEKKPTSELAMSLVSVALSAVGFWVATGAFWLYVANDAPAMLNSLFGWLICSFLGAGVAFALSWLFTRRTNREEICAGCFLGLIGMLIISLTENFSWSTIWSGLIAIAGTWIGLSWIAED